MANEVSLRDALAARRSVRDFTPQPLPRETLRRLIWAAQGVTGDDGKRTAPSAHALHPLRLRLVAGNVEGLETGLYDVDEEQAATLLKAGDLRPALQSAALEEQPWVGQAAAILAFCADMEAVTRHFVAQPPRGQRGSRYAWIEAGAAAQSALLQAAADGLGAVLVAGFNDEATDDVLGLEPPLAPLLYVCFGWPAQTD